MKKEDFRFQAHRGDSYEYPENTLVSYDAAVREGYQVIEMDTKFTADNVCICLHDGSYNRTCRFDDGSELPEKKNAADLTLEEVKKLDAGLFKGEQFRGTRIPTLAEALEFLKGKPVKLKMDNVFQGFNEEKYEIFCRTIKEADMEEQMGFTCKTLPYFIDLALKFPKAEMHYDGSLTPEALETVKKYADGRATLWIPVDSKVTAWCKERKASAEFCAELHPYGKVGIWIISELDELKAAVCDYGADIIETNGKIKPNFLDLI
ncbi:MAG: hypothetical protein MJ078_07845 [Clostridia bacterium]|nr:hypothetical protein [Clostridia bacterium]